jgi:hypothetical protein
MLQSPEHRRLWWQGVVVSGAVQTGRQVRVEQPVTLERDAVWGCRCQRCLRLTSRDRYGVLAAALWVRLKLARRAAEYRRVPSVPSCP